MIDEQSQRVDMTIRLRPLSHRGWQEAIKVLEYSENMRQLVGKLPYHLQERWRNLVWNIKERGGIVKFQNLVDFVKRESKKANDPTYGKEALLSPDQKVLGKKTSSPPRQMTLLMAKKPY